MVAVACRSAGWNVVVAFTTEVRVIETVEVGGVTVTSRKVLQSLLAILGS